MVKNPVVNAVSALVYIILVVAVMTYGTQPLHNKPDTFFAPVVFLLVFSLSAAIMAYLFFYQPLLLIIEGKKKAAVDFFVKTVGVFAIMTIVALILLFSGQI